MILNPGNYSPEHQCTSAALDIANKCEINIPGSTIPGGISPVGILGIERNLPNPYGLQQQLDLIITPSIIPSSNFK